MFKRLITALLLITLIASVAPTTDQASASGKTYYVKISSGKLNVRKKPSTSSAVVTKVAKGNKVVVQTNSKGWAKISVNGKKGYVSSKYITSNKTTYTNTAASIGSESKNTAISVAKSNLGVKYKYTGNTPSGFDCSGLVSYSYGKAGITLPRRSADMYSIGKSVTTLEPGDLLFYATSGGSKVTHVAIYIGDGQMIHSASSVGVSIISINSAYWKARFVGAKRI